MSGNDDQKDVECWKCELCLTVNNLEISKDEYKYKCYGCNTIKFQRGKTKIIHSSKWDKPGHYLSQFRDEVVAETDTFPNEQQMNQTIKNMDIKNQLLMAGYFRNEAHKQYEISMPSSIINYCIIYLFLYEDLYIGNLHKLAGVNRHIWTMFVSASKHKLLSPQSIEHIIYEIHPSYRQTIYKVSKAPFLLKKGARGSFEVKATIKFKEQYHRKDIICSHDLNYKHYATLTHIEDEKTIKAKQGFEYYFKHDGIHYDYPDEFLME